MKGYQKLETTYYDKDVIKELRKKVSNFKNMPENEVLYYNGDEKKWYMKSEPLNYLIFDKWIPKEEKKHSSLDLNNVKDVSIHLGQNVSEILLKSMNEAKNRVYISCPYVGVPTVDFFDFLLKEKKLDCKLLFSQKLITEGKHDNHSIFKKFISYKILNHDDLEKENTDEIIRLENKKKSLTNALAYLYLLFFLLSFVGGYQYLYPKYGKLGIISSVFLVLLFLRKYFSIKNKNKEIQENIRNEIERLKKRDFRYIQYNYINSNKYRYLMEDIEKAKKEDGTIDFSNIVFTHVKLYIVDDIAFLGSLNFSNTSFCNLESLIEIKDKNVVESLTKYYLNLYSSEAFHTPKDMSGELGKYIYNEEEILTRYSDY